MVYRGDHVDPWLGSKLAEYLLCLLRAQCHAIDAVHDKVDVGRVRGREIFE